MKKIILFATANPHKAQEVQQILGSGFSIELPSEHGLIEDIPENEPTLEGNALAKANYVFDRLRMPCFADDTGLEVEALDGAPGVHSARYAGESKDARANMEKLLDALKGRSNRKARFRTVIAWIGEGGESLLFEGIVNGTIAQEPKGDGGFGYDPIFIPEGDSLCFAEMTAAQKNGLSHRARAMQKLIDFLHDKN